MGPESSSAVVCISTNWRSTCNISSSRMVERVGDSVSPDDTLNKRPISAFDKVFSVKSTANYQNTKQQKNS